jgi:hypothetical protein
MIGVGSVKDQSQRLLLLQRLPGEVTCRACRLAAPQLLQLSLSRAKYGMRSYGVWCPC